MLNNSILASEINIYSTRGPSTHPDQGGNWPSTTGKPSGGNRGNAK